MILVAASHPVIRRREDPAGVGQMLGRGDIEATSRYAHPARDLAGRVNSTRLQRQAVRAGFLNDSTL